MGWPWGPVFGGRLMAPAGVLAISTLAHEPLGGQQFGSLVLDLIQQHPELVWPSGGHLVELSPEILRVHTATATGRRRHGHLGPLVGPLVGFHLSSQAILGELDGCRALGSEEVVDVISEEVWIRSEVVVGVVVLEGGIEDDLHLAHVLRQLLQLLHRGAGLLGLGQQGVLNGAGVAIQESRGLCAEVLKDLKTFVAYAA